MRQHSYFNTAVNIIQQYNGSMPLTHFLKQYFSSHKKHGSTDRKLITHLCYCYYRIGLSLKNKSIEERLRVATFLCNDKPAEWDILFDENWLNEWSGELNERIKFIQSIYPGFSLSDIFLWKDELSEGIDGIKFGLSHLIQPDLFLRIRSGKEKQVLERLVNKNIAFKKINNNCLALTNSTKVDELFELNKEVVIQDHTSQQIGKFFHYIKNAIPNPIAPFSIWDCCAASGGKSILAFDTFQNISLTVSDVRQSILKNLYQRFKESGIKNYISFIADLTNSHIAVNNSPFDLIICDAPCSGSGTWGRTPEQLYFFEKEKIKDYSLLQKKIVSNTIPYVKEDGYFLYITCSVFRKENEEIVDFIKTNFSLKLLKVELLKGYEIKADTMFAALFAAK